MAWNGKSFLEVVVQDAYNESVISNLVTNVSRENGRKGGSIDFTKSVVPVGVQTLTKTQRDADTGLTRQKLVDVTDSLTLSDLYGKRVVVGPDFYTFADYNWKGQIAEPSAREIAQERDYLVTSTITSTVDAVEVEVDPTDADALLGFFRGTVRNEVNDAKAPRSGRVLAVSSDIYSVLLGHTAFESAAHRGDSGVALAEATIGRVYGFTVVEDVNLDPATVVAFDTGAVFLGSAPLGQSSAAKESGVINTEEGLAVGYHLAYDPELSEDNIVTGVFMGVKVAVEDRVKHYVLSVEEEG